MVDLIDRRAPARRDVAWFLAAVTILIVILAALFAWLRFSDPPGSPEDGPVVSLSLEPAPATAREPLLDTDPPATPLEDEEQQLRAALARPLPPSYGPDGQLVLAPAPHPPLVELSGEGPLPIIGPAGYKPWRAYARPVADTVSGKRIAIIIGGMGLSTTATREALERLPPEVTVAFAPYARNLQEWSARARAAGHETLIEVPMEPYDFPQNDPGPHTLRATAPADENRRHLEWLLARFTGYVGVTNYLGGKFLASERAMWPFMRALAERGLMFVENGVSRPTLVRSIARTSGNAFALADRVIDGRPSEQAINARLRELESLAGQHGQAIGMGYAYPRTIDQIAAWASGLDARGISLVPVSALALEGGK